MRILEVRQPKTGCVVFSSIQRPVYVCLDMRRLVGTRKQEAGCVFMFGHMYMYMHVYIYGALNMGGGRLGSGRMTVVRRTHNRRRTQNRGGKSA